ncbi:MAG TPA: LysR family transcriptional regulator [Usitatibacter sp.]|nr:LysR family transcriptional regulator [Usitatibacter sp.]
MADQLDLRDLRYFEAIADAGHVGRAARTLSRTQPALTAAVRRLEQKLGTPLFERVGRGIRLTAAGAALHVRARAIRIAALEAQREVAQIGRGEAGVVRIGMVPTAARFLMAPLFQRFLGESPAVAFKSTIASNDVLRSALRAGELELAVDFTSSSDADLVSHALFHDECVVVASHSHPILRERPSMRDMLGYGWVLGGPAVATREWLEHAFHRRGLEAPTVQIETNQILFIPELMQASRLLSFMSRRHLAPRGPLREVALRETTMRREFAARYRHESYLSPAARRVVEALRAQGRQLRGSA